MTFKHRNLSEIYGKGREYHERILKSYWNKYNFKDICYTFLSHRKDKEVKYYTQINKVKTFRFIIQSCVDSCEMYILGIDLNYGNCFELKKTDILSFDDLKDSREDQLKTIKRICRYYYSKDCKGFGGQYCRCISCVDKYYNQ